MKNLKKTLLAFLALSLVSSFAFAEDDNWPVDDEGYSQESRSLSSQGDLSAETTDEDNIIEQRKKSKRVAKKKSKKTKKSKKKKKNI